MELKGYYTSTIGSFPLEDTNANRERCIRDLIALGIDFPAYPQLIDMGRQFLDELVSQDCGIIYEHNRYRLAGKDINVDVKPPGLEPFLWTMRYVREKGLKVNIKAAITGPFTLSSYIEVDRGSVFLSTALSDIRLVEQIAQIVSKVCEEVSKDSAMISIDEPILGIIVGARMAFKYSENDIRKILNGLKNSCKNAPTGIHICGKISPKLAGILLNSDLDFLSHEFYDSPENMKVYDPLSLKSAGKILSVGCVSSRNPRVETTEEIFELIMKFKDYNDCLIFTPDCGFRNLIIEGSRERGYEAAIAKLRNIIEAVSKFKVLSSLN
ncbi:MAG: uroporphyrinogen decarboxylase family protein [Candidatus Bathyarchaeia archaeon]